MNKLNLYEYTEDADWKRKHLLLQSTHFSHKRLKCTTPALAISVTAAGGETRPVCWGCLWCHLPCSGQMLQQSLSPQTEGLGLVPERAEFLATGLLQSVCSPLQGAQAPSTRAAFQSLGSVSIKAGGPPLLHGPGYSPLPFGNGGWASLPRLWGEWKGSFCWSLETAWFLKSACGITPNHRQPDVPPQGLELVLSSLA